MTNLKIALTFPNIKIIFFSLLFGFNLYAANNAEIKALIDDPSEQLGLSKQNAEERKVLFLDNNHKDFYNSGLILRSRQGTNNNYNELSLKIRGELTKKIPSSYFGKENFKCEYDVTLIGQSYICSLSETVKSTIPTTLQQSLLRNLGESLPANTQTFGPILSRAWKIKNGFPWLLTIEWWRFPNGDEIWEASIKLKEIQGHNFEQFIKELIGNLQRRGIHLAQKQGGKTELALNHKY